MDCTRARTELGRQPERTVPEVLDEFLHGVQRGEGAATEPMRGRKVG